MDRFDAWYTREHTTHQDQVLDLIKDYHYFAPAMLALRATQARHRTEAALGPWEEPIEVTDRATFLMQAVRMRLGALLIRLGLQLRGGLAVQPDATTAIVAAPSHAGG
jgi:hypothetical protein